MSSFGNSVPLTDSKSNDGRSSAKASSDSKLVVIRDDSTVAPYRPSTGTRPPQAAMASHEPRENAPSSRSSLLSDQSAFNERSSVQWAVGKKRRGFENVGNTCYLTAVVVAVASLPAFVDALEKLCQWALGTANIQVNSMRYFQLDFVIELVELIHEFHHSRVAPSIGHLFDLAECLKLRFAERNQKTASSFYLLIMDACEDFCDVVDALESRRMMSRLFAEFPVMLRIRSRITCGKCDHNADFTEGWLGLSVDVDEEETPGWLFKQWTGHKSLEYKCEKCGETSNAEQTVRPLSLPACLVVHYKLFHKQENNEYSKLARAPFPPLQLPLKDIPTAGCKEQSGAAYTLKALVLHAGDTLHAGHFVCAQRSGTDSSEWLLFDDDRVVELASLKELQRWIELSTPYLAFYEKTLPSAVSTSKPDETKNSRQQTPADSSAAIESSASIAPSDEVSRRRRR
ncbi:Ubiquitin carboxyl-terminal hydrolase [Aphelenchoides fujianensis]|nr:Ubiquitin carboxyl-terminal hydrolase [Aphelenchoides fujianensis]KAI6240730.1 Ubiquitin carboxyl-terminal hydrolase [Aphelenchoides fujianensis]